MSFRGAARVSRRSLRLVSRKNKEIEQVKGNLVKTVQLREWRTGTPKTRKLMCIRGDPPSHISVDLPEPHLC
jgi:hypothetical protein